MGVSHLEITKQTELAWMNMEEYLMAESKHTNSASVSGATSPISMDSSSQSSMHCNVLTDSALSDKGSMKIRLDITYDPMPVAPKTNKSICGLHRWVGVDIINQVMLLPTCNLHLCTECYHMFHTNCNLVKIKASLTKNFNKK